MNVLKSSDVLLLYMECHVNKECQEYVPINVKASLEVSYSSRPKPTIECCVTVEDSQTSIKLCDINAVYRVPNIWVDEIKSYQKQVGEIIKEKMEDFINAFMLESGHVALE